MVEMYPEDIGSKVISMRKSHAYHIDHTTLISKEYYMKKTLHYSLHIDIKYMISQYFLDLSFRF